MKVEYTNRAVADLRKASVDSRAAFGDLVAAALERRIREVVEHIAANPGAAPQVVQRSGMRVFPLIRYPYKIFYRVLVDRVRIVHIRHTSRRPWFR
jgi:plasmid stabilization system protein ParE